MIGRFSLVHVKDDHADLDMFVPYDCTLFGLESLSLSFLVLVFLFSKCRHAHILNLVSSKSDPVKKFFVCALVVYFCL